MSLTDYVIMPGSHYQNICDSVRAKTGKTADLKSGDISSEVDSITGGGVEPKDVNFYDYDGTLLYSYTLEEFEQRNRVLPDLPESPAFDIVNKKWNFYYSNQYLDSNCPMDFGLEYGWAYTGIKLKVEIHGWSVPVTVGFGLKGGAYVEWGDETENTTLTGTTTSTTVFANHTYSNPGTYYIRISRNDLESDFKIDITGSTKGSYLFRAGTYTSVDASSSSATVSDNMLLKEVLIGDKVSKIAAHGLAGLNIEYIGFPNTVTSIGQGAFFQCYQLKHAAIPNSITTIPALAFAYCHTLRTIAISGSVETIGDDSFLDCYSLEKLVLPNGTTATNNSLASGYYPFEHCYNVKKVVIPKTFNSDDIIDILCTLPNAQELIIDCDNRAITNSGHPAYGANSIHTIKLIGSVTEFSNGTFISSSAKLIDLSEITTMPTVGPGTFSRSCKIYVPDFLYNTMIADTNWSSYQDILVPV